MAGEEKRMEKHRDMEGDGKSDGHNTGEIPEHQIQS